MWGKGKGENTAMRRGKSTAMQRVRVTTAPIIQAVWENQGTMSKAESIQSKE